MVKRPLLLSRMTIRQSQKEMGTTGSKYKALSADVASKHGFNIHGVIFDELHTQPNRKLFDVMTKGSGDARTQPLYFLITTAGDNVNSICYEQHQKAKDILEGRKHDATFYPVIFGASEDEDWTDPKVWKKANPSLGITVAIDKVKAACDSAKQNREENAFRQLRLNQWVKQAIRWMPMDKWMPVHFRSSLMRLKAVSVMADLTFIHHRPYGILPCVPPEDEDEPFYVLPYFWSLKICWNFVSSVTMFRTTCGRSKVTSKPLKATSFTTDLSKFIESMGENTTSARLHLTVGVRRCVQNLELWDLPLFLWVRALRMSHKGTYDTYSSTENCTRRSSGSKVEYG